jgi:hypothetical protein
MRLRAMPQLLRRKGTLPRWRWRSLVFENLRADVRAGRRRAAGTHAIKRRAEMQRSFRRAA